MALADPVERPEPLSAEGALSEVDKILRRGGDDAIERAREVIALHFEPHGALARAVAVHRVLADVLYYHSIAIGGLDQGGAKAVSYLRDAERDAFTRRCELAKAQ